MQSVDSVDFQFAVSVNENAGFFRYRAERGDVETNLVSTETNKTKPLLTQRAIRWSAVWSGTASGDMKKRKRLLSSTNLFKTRHDQRDGLPARAVNLGLIYLTQGRTLDAEKLSRTRWAMGETALGKKQSGLCGQPEQPAKLHQTTGKYNEAEKEFNEAIALCDKVFGVGKAKAILLNNKAMLFLAIGR